MKRHLLFLPVLFLAPAVVSQPTPPSPKAEPPGKAAVADAPYLGPRLRPIGPAIFSGRIAALAVHPTNPARLFAGVASGGVWKTVNAGTSWTPVFDDMPSYSIGALALDPRDPNTLWVGTGENHAQRSVGYGDGVYVTRDGGKSFARAGLPTSEHIGRIDVDPRDPNTVLVAAQGPLWRSGGERGLYRTRDGGKTWERLLHVSDDTGVTDVIRDPRNPDILLAASWQRRRHVWTLVNGGPESAVHRSTDGGKSWRKVSGGLPGGDVGRIGLAYAPSSPDVIYATVEAADGKGGVFRSADNGLTWERRNPFDSLGMYYGTVVVDPKNADRIFVMNTFIMTSDDGGTTLRRLGMNNMHVDCHCMWVNPNDTDHYLVGCDGGLYESHDRAKTWRHIRNLPVTQFYDVTCSQDGPYYRVYGGTQDNNTLGGPARTRSTAGITNADWEAVHLGDGFQCKVDPKNPNIVYAEAQYGDLVRHDRATGQTVGIRPHLPAGEPPLRWNWDSPLLLSAHLPTRLYFAANRLFRSDDRGQSWKVVSPDLTRKIDRNLLPVMGRMWGPDAVYRHGSTSPYGNVTALAESPLDENVLYAGTDDGLISVTGDGGKTWQRVATFPGVPANTYVTKIAASNHDKDVVYAAFNNHKNGDFKPYLLRSADRGKTWSPIANNLPENGPLWVVAEDHAEKQLLFVGSEFGLFYSQDAGKTWVRVRGGLPTIPVRDLAIQRTQNDLVVGTFGRGIYILDDYSPLRRLTPAVAKEAATLLPVRDARQLIPRRPFGQRGKSWFGEAFFTADNPPEGVWIDYHLAEGLKTKKSQRQEREKKPTFPYPSADELRAEAAEETPAVVLEVRDAADAVVRRLTGPATKGFHRVVWDTRGPGPAPAAVRDDDPFRAPSDGPLLAAGTYTVKMLLRGSDGSLKDTGEVRTAKVIDDTGVGADERKEAVAFADEVMAVRRRLSAATAWAGELADKLAAIQRAGDATPGVPESTRARVRDLRGRLTAVIRSLRGDEVLRSRNETTAASVGEKVGAVVSGTRHYVGTPTKTHRDLIAEAAKELTAAGAELKAMTDKDVAEIEAALDKAGAPPTPGRRPR